MSAAAVSGGSCSALAITSLRMRVPAIPQTLRHRLCCWAVAVTVAAGCCGCATTQRPAPGVTSSSIKTALDCFEVDCGRFPTKAEGLGSLVKDPGVPGWKGPYWEGSFCDRWGTPWQYQGAAARSLSILSAGPDKVFGTSDDLAVTWTWSH